MVSGFIRLQNQQTVFPHGAIFLDIVLPCGKKCAYFKTFDGIKSTTTKIPKDAFLQIMKNIISYLSVPKTNYPNNVSTSGFSLEVSLEDRNNPFYFNANTGVSFYQNAINPRVLEYLNGLKNDLDCRPCQMYSRCDNECGYRRNAGRFSRGIGRNVGGCSSGRCSKNNF